MLAERNPVGVFAPTSKRNPPLNALCIIVLPVSRELGAMIDLRNTRVFSIIGISRVLLVFFLRPVLD